jgi:hypothetical protein
MKEPIAWYSDFTNALIKQLDANELELFNADMQDAIDGVLEDWKVK